MSILGIKTSKAYQIIRGLNKELEKDGYITVAGRIPVAKFNERMGIL
ncbi:hypothetical protein KG090_00485 [Carnobacteriaceae bacterium zg-ZUI240]|nr:hypothetical protein [Carnobacteriaceae bacterium zg-ZUI240]